MYDQKLNLLRKLAKYGGLKKLREIMYRSVNIVDYRD